MQHSLSTLRVSGKMEMLKIFSRSRAVTFTAMVQLSAPTAQLRRRPHFNRCFRCWLSSDRQKVRGRECLVPCPFRLPLTRGLRTTLLMQQKTCTKYDSSGTECCSNQHQGSPDELTCWQCGQMIDDITERYFCKCGVVQPPVTKRSYFNVMGIEETFDVDLTVLAEKYRNLQRVLHPDKYSQKCDTEKEFSLQHSGIVNRAYNTLQQPLARGLYMLQLSEDKLEHETQIDMAEFLNEILEVSESILEADSPDAVAAIGAENQAKIDQLVCRISDAFKQGDHASAKELLLRLKYYSNVDEKVKQDLQNYAG